MHSSHAAHFPPQWGIHGLVLGMLLATPMLAQEAADQHELKDERAAGDRQQVTVHMQLSGQLAVPAQDGESKSLGVSANNKLIYHECIHSLRPSAWISGRYYKTAEAKVQVAGTEQVLKLGKQQRLVRTSSPGKPSLTAAKQPLSREELDMLTVPGSSLDVYRLLPGRAVQTGETWQPESDGLARLLNLDEVTVNQTRVRLVEVTRGLAKMQIAGTMLGNVDGVATEIAVEGDLRYDMNWKRINWLQLVVKEQREPSPVQAGFTIKAELRMLCEPQDQSPLTAEITGKLVRASASHEDRLRYEFPESGCRCVHSPAWHVVEEDPTGASLRLVVQGGMIAQCNLRRLADVEPEQPLTLEKFQSDVQAALKDQFGEFESAQEGQRDDGYRVLQVTVKGTSAELPIRWLYYHLTSPEGQAASCIFTMQSSMASSFADSGEMLIGGLQLSARQTKVLAGNTPDAQASRTQPGTPADTARR